MRIGAAAAALVAFVGCGGKDANQVNGSYRGQSIDVADGLLLPPQRDLFGGVVSVVVLESASDVCSLMQTGVINNTRLITIGLGIETEKGFLKPASEIGTYLIGGPAFLSPGTKLAGLRFGLIDPCGRNSTADAVSGTVQITSVAPNLSGTVAYMDGTFQAVFDNGETLSGAFHVSMCTGARLSFGLCR
ncbi:MAG: hypothetical protein ACJ78X_19090 [Myxococcales bacterium]